MQVHAGNVSLYNLNIANTYGKVRGSGGRSRPFRPILNVLRSRVFTFAGIWPHASVARPLPGHIYIGRRTGTLASYQGSSFGDYVPNRDAGAGHCAQCSGWPVWRLWPQDHRRPVSGLLHTRISIINEIFVATRPGTLYWRMSARMSAATF